MSKEEASISTLSSTEVLFIKTCLNIIDVILDENLAPAYAFFEDIVMDGVETIHFIPELLDTMSLFQV